MAVIHHVKRGLVVSCQAKVGSPLRHPLVMALMAQAAAQGGAVGIRANGVDDIRAIKRVVALPIIGINKQVLADYEVLITPTLAAAQEVVAAGADIVAMDATQRARPDGLSASEAIRAYKQALSVPIMADISTIDEGLAAAQAGADLIATTLSGYTSYSPQQRAPDFALVAALAAQIDVPLIAEGRFATPLDARRAFELGAYAVVVGSAITAVDWITQQFVSECAKVSSKEVL